MGRTLPPFAAVRAFEAAARHAEEAGAEVRVIRLRDFPIAIYDGDLEASGDWPESVDALHEHFAWADGLMIASPEYNSAISAALKNTIDWLSRPKGDRLGLSAFKGKTAALFAASPGALGGIRGLPGVRAILQNIGVTVVPGMYALGGAHEAFNGDGSLKDASKDEGVKAVATALVEATSRLGPSL